MVCAFALEVVQVSQRTVLAIFIIFFDFSYHWAYSDVNLCLASIQSQLLRHALATQSHTPTVRL